MDISRASHDARKHYDATRSLQGRLLTDDDLNLADILAKEDRRRTRLDLIGPQGSPDDGFALDKATLSGTGEVDVTIRPGTLYVGGLRLVMDADATGAGERFAAQSDWLQQGTADRKPAATAPRTDLVVVEAWQQPVEAVEDRELIEPALGGIDTSARIRTMRRVRLVGGIGTDDCDIAWQAFAKSVGGIDRDGALHSDARLRVTFDTEGTVEDLCTPHAVGGFLGALNQAIRVELVSASTLVWGFDNGAPLYRAVVSGSTVKLLTPPRDQLHWPRVGQTVELIAWSAILPNGEKLAETRIPLPSAGATSHFAQVTKPFQPDAGSFEINLPPPADFNQAWKNRYPAGTIDHGGKDTYLFLRIWNRGADLSPLPATFTPGSEFPLTGTGLRVTLSGAVRRPGDYWVIAARPRTPTGVVPWRLAEGAPPTGPQRHYAPLGLLTWAAGNATAQVHDCRARIYPVTTPSGCCALNIAPGPGWERAFQGLARGQDVNVCFSPGDYPVTRRIDLADLGEVRITGAGRGTRLVGATLETIFRFIRCKTVIVRDLYAETGAAVPGRDRALPVLNGTLTFDDCLGVTVESVGLRCGTTNVPTASCLSVITRAPAPRITRAGAPSIRIQHCDLGIGHLQVGILVVDADRAVITDNSLAVVNPDTPQQLRAMQESPAFRRRLRTALVSALHVDTPPKGVATNVQLPLGGRTLRFQTAPALTGAWAGALARRPAPERLSVPAARRFLYQVADEVLRPGAAALPGFGPFLEAVRASFRPVASQGIVVGGRRATDIRIAENTIDGVIQGVHLGLSHRAQPRTDPGDQAGRVRIEGNRITLRVTPDSIGARHGIFVGGCDSLVIDANYVAVQRDPSGQTRPVEGIRADGRMGAMLLIQRNHFDGCTTGVVVWVPLAQVGFGTRSLWKVSENMAGGAGASVAVQVMAGTAPAPADMVQLGTGRLPPDRNKP